MHYLTIAFSCLCVYLFIFAGLRLLGKRDLAQMSMVDPAHLQRGAECHGGAGHLPAGRVGRRGRPVCRQPDPQIPDPPLPQAGQSAGGAVSDAYLQREDRGGKLEKVRDLAGRAGGSDPGARGLLGGGSQPGRPGDRRQRQRPVRPLW